MIDQMPSLIRLRNGEKARSHMEAQSIDAVLFTSYHNINYYSDFLYCSSAVSTAWP